MSRLGDQTRKLKVELREVKMETAEIKTAVESKIPAIIQQGSQRMYELLEEEREKTEDEAKRSEALSKAARAGLKRTSEG